MIVLSESETVGQLVAQQAGRAAVFERLGIDYCCGGGQTLAAACAERGLDWQAVVDALQAADGAAIRGNEPDWNDAPLAELIDHIIETHHAYLCGEMPRVSMLAAKVANVHGVRHSELGELRDVFEGLRAELELHMLKEERILFPMIREMEATRTLESVHCGSVGNPIRAMEAEHDAAGTALARLRALTCDYTAPADGCGSYRVLMSSLAALEADLHQHIHKENNILFPRAAALEAALSE